MSFNSLAATQSDFCVVFQRAENVQIRTVLLALKCVTGCAKQSAGYVSVVGVDLRVNVRLRPALLNKMIRFLSSDISYRLKLS